MLALEILAPSAGLVRSVAASTRTRRGFRAPARRRAAAPQSLPLLDVAGAAWAFEPDRRLVASVAPVAAPAAPVVVAPAPVAPVAEIAAPAPVRVPAGAASVRVASPVSAFRVVVVDLDSDELESVRVEAASPLAARRECSDEFALPVAVFALLPGGEELVWGEAA